MEERPKNTSQKKISKNMEEELNIVDKAKNNEPNQNIIKGKSLTNTNKSNIKNGNTNEISLLNEQKLLEKPKEKIFKIADLKSSVKSKYIIQKIFLHLNDKKKIFMIRYNKYYNNLLEIDIELYKKISGKIKIGGVNGYGKEYKLDSMDLIFKGFYIKGKRNGEGKEYSGGNLLFEGEYVNGKRHGKGIEYSYSGKLLFVGEYINGKKWNGKFQEYDGNLIKFDGEYYKGKKKGKEFDEEGKLIFEGEYLNGKRWNGIIYNHIDNLQFPIENGNGKVREYNKKEELIFDGEYLNGERNGKGKEYDIDYNELIFEGEYLNGKRWNGKLKKYSKSHFFRDKFGSGGCPCCLRHFAESDKKI